MNRIQIEEGRSTTLLLMYSISAHLLLDIHEMVYVRKCAAAQPESISMYSRKLKVSRHRRLSGYILHMISF